MKLFESLKQNILQLIYPKRCLICSKVVSSKETVCKECIDNLPWIEPPICMSCGRGSPYCTCAKNFAFIRCVAPFYYEGKAKTAVLRLKFYSRPEAAVVLGAQMYDTVVKEYGRNAADIVCCVPMGKAALKRRGYNQAELLAKEIARLLDRPFEENILAKVLQNPPQHTVDANKRWPNVMGAFDVTRPQAISGKDILLVDDVLTSGATLNECARVLREAGAKSVYCVVCAATRSRTLVKKLKISYNVKTNSNVQSYGMFSLDKPKKIEIKPEKNMKYMNRS